ncbi:MAG: hypothetical protein L6R42_009961, partial [Xanthoria sp. 1 TBL-2021]
WITKENRASSILGLSGQISEMAALNSGIDPKVMRFSFVEYDDLPSQPNQQHGLHGIPLLPRRHQTSAPYSEICNVGDQEPKKLAIDERRRTRFLYCLPHILPMMVTIVLLSLNIRGGYWQDLDQPNQSSVLQALQYAAKAHEIMAIASLTTIIVYRIQHDISSPSDVPLGLLPAGFLFSSPNYAFSKAFLGGATARSYDKGPSRYFPLSLLLVFLVGCAHGNGFWDRVHDTVFFNRTADELWPADITNAIYADLADCTVAFQTDEIYCAARALQSVLSWTGMRQNQGTPPNITIFEDDQISRFLTSEGGPPDNSSWTVTSTVGSIFATDLAHYWDWLAQNTTLPTKISRPLLKPTPVDPDFQLKKPLVQVQCHSYLDPDFAHDVFEFPHDELRKPPLDSSMAELGVFSQCFCDGPQGDMTYPWELFDWFDTASNFSTQGAPSLGAVIIYKSLDGEKYNETLTACSIDGRWAPVEYSLDPKDTFTIRQDSPNPMDILRGPDKKDPKNLTQMNMTLGWANSMNTFYEEPGYPPSSAVERLLTGWGGNSIYTEQTA